MVWSFTNNVEFCLILVCIKVLVQEDVVCLRNDQISLQPQGTIDFMWLLFRPVEVQREIMNTNT